MDGQEQPTQVEGNRNEQPEEESTGDQKHGMSDQIESQPSHSTTKEETPLADLQENVNDLEDDDDYDEPSSLLEQIQNRIPRIYYVITQLMLPLLLLIAMCFLFGWLLALFEMQGEIESNNAELSKVVEQYMRYGRKRQALWEEVANITEQCQAESVVNQEALDQAWFKNISGNATRPPEEVVDATEELEQQRVQQCALDLAETLFNQTSFVPFLVESLGDGGGLTFNWMKCEMITNNNTVKQEEFEELGLKWESDYDQQFFSYVVNYGEDFYALGAQPELRNATSLTLGFADRATGSDGCTVHVAGGALFWFTIMTTIGYGNTAPATDGGRILVYTCGFLTILGFIALNNTASNVWQHLFEDVFKKWNLHRLVRGPFSVLFWLCITILWMLVIALAMCSYRWNRIGEAYDEFPLADGFWFSYITITTVGFGDIHISHEEFESGDMFYLPLIILMGFNFLAIFAGQLIDLCNDYLPERSNFETILERKRRRHRSQKKRLSMAKEEIQN